MTTYVFGRSWIDTTGGPGGVDAPSITAGVTNINGRTQLTGSSPITLTFERDGADNTDYGFRCLAYSASSGGTQQWKSPSALYVTTGADNTAPNAALTVTPDPVTEGKNVTANASASTDPQGQALTYTYHWGDGATTGPQSASSAVHGYSDEGVYNVTVTVTDTGGLSDSAGPDATTVKSSTLFGANSTGSYLGTYDPLDVQRVFHMGAPGPWSSAPLNNGLPTVVSFKYPVSSILAGTHDAFLRSWFSSMPTNREIHWTYYHEPEDDIANGTFSAANYRAAFIRIRNISKEAAVVKSNVFADLVLMDWTAASGSGRDWYNYYPDNDTTRSNGSTYVDVLSWDVYEFDEEPGDPDPNQLTMNEHLNRPGGNQALKRDIVSINAVTGDPMAVAELGYDDVTDRPAFLSNFGDWAADKDLVYATYFDYDGTTGDHRLNDTASQQVWEDVIAY